MKKILALIIIAILCVGLTACENDEKSNTKPVETNQSTKNEQKPKEETTASESKEETKGSGEQTIVEPLNSGENIVVEDKKQEPAEEKNSSGYTVIKFSDMYDVKGTIKNVSTKLKNLNGKKVEIKGYPAVQSPLDESFVYLNNQPYVTCPFCTIGDITKLEVIPIYMANKGKIKYTENSLTVYGTLEVAEKKDSEGYTTQFRVYADKVEEAKDSNANKAVNDYYKMLSQQGMIYDIQTLQMNIEYASNPQYMAYYDEKYQTGQSPIIDKVAVVKGISNEYLGYDSQYASGYGSGYVYLDYIKECPQIVKECEPSDAKLKGLNDELIKMYLEEIKILEKFQNICYRIHEKSSITSKEAEAFIKELNSLNADNLKQYNAFTDWNNRLRD